MSRDLMIQLAGLHSFAFALFHMSFWKLFRWDRELAKVGLPTRAVTQILNLRLIYVFLGMGTLFWGSMMEGPSGLLIALGLAGSYGRVTAGGGRTASMTPAVPNGICRSSAPRASNLPAPAAQSYCPTLWGSCAAASGTTSRRVITRSAASSIACFSAARCCCHRPRLANAAIAAIASSQPTTSVPPRLTETRPAAAIMRAPRRTPPDRAPRAGAA